MSAMRAHVEFYQATVEPHQDEETGLRDWRWRVKAGNNEIVASGEGYTREADAKRGFEDAAEAIRIAFMNFLIEKRTPTTDSLDEQA